MISFLTYVKSKLSRSWGWRWFILLLVILQEVPILGCDTQLPIKGFTMRFQYIIVLLSYLLYSKLTTARDSICKLRKTLKFKSVSQKLNLYLFDLSKYRIFFILKREATFLSCFFMFALIDFLSGNIFVAHLSEKPAQLLQQRRRQLFHEYFKAINAYDALLTGRQTDRETEDRQPADRPTNE